MLSSHYTDQIATQDTNRHPEEERRKAMDESNAMMKWQLGCLVYSSGEPSRKGKAGVRHELLACLKHAISRNRK